jgi:DNA-binding beta-propeller fold protein YncE
MPQDDYTITTDPSGALLQNLKYITYTNTDLSYIPQFMQTYELDDIELNQVSNYFYPYAGPSALQQFGFGAGFMTYDTLLDKIYIGNGGVISEWTGTSLVNVFVIDGSGIPINKNYNIGTLGIAYNPQNNLLYAIMSNVYTTNIYPPPSSCIIVIDILTRTQRNFVINNVDFISLIGINFDISNNLYVTDNSNHNVIKIILTDNYNGNGTIIANFSDGVFKPTGITSDQFNNIYISNAGSNNILKISNTAVVSIFATANYTFTSGFTNPMQIEYNFTNNVIYVANYGQPGVGVPTRICTITNGIVQTLFYSNTGTYYFGITSDSVGNIYYTASSSNTAQSGTNQSIGKISSIGTITACANTYTDAYDSYSISPITSVAINYTQNKLYASQYNAPWPQSYPFDPSYNYSPYGIIWNISLTDPSFNPVLFYPLVPATDPSMNNPSSIAFDANNNLYVGNSIDSKILVINSSASGAYLNISGVATNGPTGLTFNTTGNLYFANYLSGTICKLTFSNAYNATGITLPITGASISYPTGLAIDNSNNILYIANSGLNNILSVDLSNNNATIYSTITTGGTQNPQGIVYDSKRGLLYLTDNYTNNVEVIANNRIINDITLSSNTPQIIIPQGIAIDTTNDVLGLPKSILYVANYGNYDAPIVKIINGITNTIVYNSKQAAILNGASVSIWYKSNSVAGTYLFVTDFNANYVPVIDSLGVNINYGSIGDVNPNKGIVRNVITPATNTAPYFVYLVNTDGNFRLYALAPNLTSTNPLYDTPTNGSIAIPDMTIYETAAINGITFDSAPVDPSGNIYLYVSYTTAQRIYKIRIDCSTNFFVGYGDRLNIDFTSINFQPGNITIAPDNITMFCIEAITSNPAKVCKIDLTAISPSPATPYIPVVIATLSLAFQEQNSITTDNKGYVYILYNSFGSPPGPGNRYIRLAPNPNPSISTYIIETLVPYSISSKTALNRANGIAYSSTDNSIVVACEPSVEKIYLSFLFDCSGAPAPIGPYSNDLYICNVLPGTSSTNPPEFDFSFNVYSNYIVIDPSNIPQNSPTNTSTNTSFYFVNPSVLPNPTDTYYLLCGTTKIADAFCNNCTYNKTKFLSGTYPTGLIYSDFSEYLYVALQNNTISRIKTTGIVENEYIPASIGLKGPTSLVLDSNFNMYVLNVSGGFITKLTLDNEIITADNSFYTNIQTPICLTYDYITNNYLYLLSGKVPNMVVTQIDITNPANFIYLPISFGSLYNSNGLVIGAPTIYEQYLYISNTDQFNVNSIKKFNLLDASYNLTTELSGLSYKPYTLDYINQYLYVSNKNLPSSISKIRVASNYLGIPASVTQPWAVNGISIPSDLTHDASGNLYVANTGTGPRNSRISKIYIDYFPFNNVILPNGTCANAQIYDITTQSCVEVDYYPPSSNPCSFPIPIPYPIGS